MIEKKTTEEIRNMDLTEDCPKIGLTDAIDTNKYYDYLKIQKSKVWVSEESHIAELLRIKKELYEKLNEFFQYS